MPQQEPRAIRFMGGTPFVTLTIQLWGRIDEIGAWVEPGEHLVHPDDAEFFTELLETSGLTKGKDFSTCPEYLDEALYRISDPD